MKDNRRNFISKFSLTLAAVLGLRTARSKNNPMPEANKETVKRIRPLGFQWETLDPFLFCVHHDDKFPKGNSKMEPAVSLEGRMIGQDFIIKDGWRMYHGKTIPGFPGHPHRGFETITVVRKGIVDHADSMGGAGRYGDGDVQWMTAGKGIQHSEMFPLIHSDKENPMELFQIWLNLPRKSKYVEPHYKMFWNKDIPKIDLEGSLVEVIAGKFNNAKAPDAPPNSWANESENEVCVLNILIKPNQKFELPASLHGLSKSLYFYEGTKIRIDNHEIECFNAADLLSERPITIENLGNKEAKLLLLQGRPIGEPVVQHGPFVMNSKQEIHQAFEDYHQTQFGGWPWPKLDQVHDRNKGKFALHSDGKLEQG